MFNKTFLFMAFLVCFAGIQVAEGAPKKQYCSSGYEYDKKTRTCQRICDAGYEYSAFIDACYSLSTGDVTTKRCCNGSLEG